MEQTGSDVNEKSKYTSLVENVKDREDCPFLEVFSEKEEKERNEVSLPDVIEVYVSVVDPRQCSAVMKELGHLFPLMNGSVDDVESEFLVRNGIGEDSEFKTFMSVDDNINYSDGNQSSMNSNGIQSIRWPFLGHLKRVYSYCIPSVTQLNAAESRSSSSVNNETFVQTSAHDLTYGANSKRKRSRKRSHNGISKIKMPKRIEILIGSVAHIDFILSHNTITSSTTVTETPHKDNIVAPKENLMRIISTYNLKMTKQYVPGRYAKSRDELNYWKKNMITTNSFHPHCNHELVIQPSGMKCKRWPTVFRDEHTESYKSEQLKLTDEEIKCMKVGMEHAIMDAKRWSEVIICKNTESPSGVVIMDPKSQVIVSRSFDESLIQEKSFEAPTEINQVNNLTRHHYKQPYLTNINPLSTTVILAIQGVSRRERNVAMGAGIDSDSFKNGQYLCTGYDVYLTREPSIFEAMALVHSRARRIIFGAPNHVDGGLGGSSKTISIHSLPGTNHHYRVFRCNYGNATNVENLLHTDCSIDLN
mmetsp:Transcript_13348/g.19089  ORF Transcript_13348/g.19089 Transcript_13348/m.19089 type:complete len:532 (-) Transcript_13348:381-1976(-)